jgi:hypothetical protein
MCHVNHQACVNFFIRAAILEKNSLFNRFGVIFKANKFGFSIKYVGKDCFFTYMFC